MATCYLSPSCAATCALLGAIDVFPHSLPHSLTHSVTLVGAAALGHARTNAQPVPSSPPARLFPRCRVVPRVQYAASRSPVPMVGYSSIAYVDILRTRPMTVEGRGLMCLAVHCPPAHTHTHTASK